MKIKEMNKMSEIDIEKNKILDEIIASRRTIREFTSDIPPRDHINAILEAGLQAPFAAIAVIGEKKFRRFFVVKDGESMNKLSEIIQKRIRVVYDNLSEKAGTYPEAEVFLGVLKNITVSGFNIRSPYLVIVAEKEGFLPVAQLSIAHCLENMWLKATALGLGFQLVSMVSDLSKDPEFCEFIGVKPGEYATNGCVIGYIQTVPPKVERPLLNEITKWID
jgi:nitroreductase